MAEDGYGVIAATFEDVGKATIDIQNILPVSEEAGEDIGDGSYDIQTIKPDGTMSEQFSYKTVHEDNVAKNGWYDANDQLAKKTLTLGEGLWYYSYWANSSLLFSGEVEMGAIDMPLCEDGYGVTGVARPAGINIQDILPISDEAGEDVGDGSYDVQTIKPDGTMNEQFSYKTVHEDNVEKDGWYDANDKLATKDLAAGEGLWYYSYWGGSFFRLKALDAKDAE